MISTTLVCPDSVPTLWGVLDPSIAPPLLYYSYVPIIVVALFFSALILIGDRYSLQSRLLFAVSAMFSLYLLNELVHWIATPVVLVHYAWQLTALIHVVLAAFIAAFITAFIYDRLPTWFGWAIAAAVLPVAILTPSVFNIPAFDLINCEGLNGPLWGYVYVVETLTLVYVIVLSVRAYLKEKEKSTKKKALITGIGGLLFLSLFTVSNVVGDITLVYNFNLFGPIGMVGFLTVIAYLIVRYQAFNMRVLGAQVLVGALVALVFAALFVRTVEYVRYVLLGTLILVIILGYILVRGVKREVKQREQIEELAKDLADTNKRQETLIHFIGHEVKGFLTKAQGALAGLAEGDFGALTDTAKPFVEHALAETRTGVESVTAILKASNQKKGTISYQMGLLDLCALVKEQVEKARPTAEKKGLKLTITLEGAIKTCTMTGDKAELGEHVFRNLIDNAVNYTPSGSIEVSLKRTNGTYIFAVKDSGIGISDEDKKRLFTEGGHGKDSQKINVHSTGYGLFIAKNIVEAHHGKIRAESEGPGKGSTFVVELPA